MNRQVALRTAISAAMLIGTAGAAFPWHAWKKSGVLASGALSYYNAVTYTTLYSFTGGSDGGAPTSGLTAGGGVLFGTTSSPAEAYLLAPGTPWTQVPLAGLFPGVSQSMTLVSPNTVIGVEAGDVFTLTNTGSGVTKAYVYTFPTGVVPTSPLIAYNDRVVFGTATGGGNGGVVYSLAFNTSHWVYKVIHTFTTGGAGGSGPSGALAWGKYQTALFGTTTSGGTGNGVLYSIQLPLGPTPTEKVLHTFTGGSDGAAPNGVITDSSFNIFGTTAGGGAGSGTIYKLAGTAGRAFSSLYTFVNAADGTAPNGTLGIDAGGALYGTASGGVYGSGTSYILEKPVSAGKPWRLEVLHSFGSGGSDGITPAGGQILDNSGTVYGVTTGGGANGKGSVYSILP